jgi:soluble lytic murein transglycosylase-like protein
VSVVLVALAASAWSQTAHYTVPAAEVEDDFEANRQALDSAADLALATVMQEAAMSSQIAEAAAETTAPPDAKALHQFAKQYWNGNDEAVRRAVARMDQLKPVLTSILHEQGVPDEAVALVFVESAGETSALSPKGARGIWQFMPDTARRYGLTVNFKTDDRLDVQKSTRAAARYLRDLHSQFRSWPLALAAYNAGEKLVQNAVLRAGSEDFALLDRKRLLPAETRAYVPAVMAASTLLSGGHLLGTSQSQGAISPSVLYASSAAGGGR